MSQDFFKNLLDQGLPKDIIIDNAEVFQSLIDSDEIFPYEARVRTSAQGTLFLLWSQEKRRVKLEFQYEDEDWAPFLVCKDGGKRKAVRYATFPNRLDFMSSFLWLHADK